MTDKILRPISVYMSNSRIKYIRDLFNKTFLNAGSTLEDWIKVYNDAREFSEFCLCIRKGLTNCPEEYLPVWKNWEDDALEIHKYSGKVTAKLTNKD